jgi:hypothetical protein
MAQPVYIPRKTQRALFLVLSVHSSRLNFVAAHFWPIAPEIRMFKPCGRFLASMAMAVTEPFITHSTASE